jgi:hypothetical protein
MRVMMVVMLMIVSYKTRCRDADLAVAGSVGRVVDFNEFCDRGSIGGVRRWRMVVVVRAFGREGNPAHVSLCLDGSTAPDEVFRSRTAVEGDEWEREVQCDDG